MRNFWARMRNIFWKYHNNMEELPQLLKEIEDIKTSIGEVQGSLNDLAKLNIFDVVDTSKARSSMDSSYKMHFEACERIRTMELNKLSSTYQILINKLTEVNTRLNTALTKLKNVQMSSDTQV